MKIQPLRKTNNNPLAYSLWIGLWFLCWIPDSFSSEPGQASVSPATLSITVKDAIVLALQNNLSLQVERYGPEIASSFVDQSLETFDPNITAQYSFAEEKEQRSSGVGEFRDVASIDQNVQAGISKRLQNGIDVSLNTRVFKQKSNVFSTLFSTRVGASVTVPLLEGRGRAVNLVGVRQTQKDAQISQQELHGFIQALISQIENLYWDLYLSREELRIIQASKTLAEEQLRETEERIEVGDLPEIELAAAESEVALREEAVIDAQSDYDINRLELAARINPPIDSYWTLPIELIESPTTAVELPGEIEDYVETAHQFRPDLLEAEIRLSRNELQLVRTKNGLLPQLDFFVTFGRTGFANTFSDTFSNFEQNNFDLNLGFQFQHRFGRRGQKARHQQAELELSEAQAALQNFELLIELDVRTAYTEIERFRKQVKATRTAAYWENQKYQAEVEKFRVGNSTNLLVLIAQRDLVQSHLEEIRAMVNLRKAESDFYFFTGTLTGYHNVVLPQPLDG